MGTSSISAAAAAVSSAAKARAAGELVLSGCRRRCSLAAAEKPANDATEPTRLIAWAGKGHTVDDLWRATSSSLA